LTTIKLSKTPINTPSAGKAPVRRADPTKRDRTKAPPKPVIRSDNAEETPRSNTAKAPGNKPTRDSKPNNRTTPYTSNKAPSTAKPDSTRQRNHRHDGSLREDSQARPARSQESTEARPAISPNVDTRTTPRGSREEPQYRQAPRRGGKARDGYDANAPTYGAAAKAAYKPAASTVSDDLPRLSKLMAERGLCSRREADEWIVNGWVKVNGEIIETLGTRVAPDVEIVISGYAKEHQAENVTILLHKPVGYVSGQAEDDYEPAIVLVHPENQWEEDTTQKTFQRGFLKGLAPAGRLDIDSTGLLVLTQDGRVARHLIGEDSTVEKEYLVRVEGELSHDGLTKLNYGLSLDGVKLKPAKVSWQNEDQLRFVLREGKKRQIRRMCEMVGLKVVGLKRIRIGSVTLGKLPVGEWRYLRPDERF
jgi:23S rRNA pseudouridine2604 synthase